MPEAHRILDQLQRAYDGEAWHGPPLRAILADITAAQAAARPLPNAHSIWELVLHIAAWQDATRKALGGVPLDVSDEENFPPIPDASDATWQQTLAALDAAHHGLCDAAVRLTDADLERTAPGRHYSVYVLLHGVVQHNLYHAGQIVLLKKAL